MSREKYRKQMRRVADQARMLAGWIDDHLEDEKNTHGPNLVHLHELVQMFKDAKKERRQ